MSRRAKLLRTIACIFVAGWWTYLTRTGPYLPAYVIVVILTAMTFGVFTLVGMLWDAVLPPRHHRVR